MTKHQVINPATNRLCQILTRAVDSDVMTLRESALIYVSVRHVAETMVDDAEFARKFGEHTATDIKGELIDLMV